MESLITLKQALDAGLITTEDYDGAKTAFLRAQQIRSGFESGLLSKADYAVVKASFLTSLGSADGVGTAASFNWPYGVAADAMGHAIVADSWNNAIRRVSPSGAVTTVAGGAAAAWADGVASAARFNMPAGVAVDAAGSIDDIHTHVKALAVTRMEEVARAPLRALWRGEPLDGC
jgi:DNA-binding beta-propeller fold protein YncE